jgi:hypothetical protein
MCVKGGGSVSLLVLVAMTANCSASSAQRGDALSPERVAGCYRLDLWPGESGPEAEQERAAWSVPPQVKLERDTLTAWPSLVQQYGTVFLAHTISASGEVRDHPFQYWRFVNGDSLYVGHPRAFAGVSLDLEIEGRDLRGQITSFTDVRMEDKPSRVTAPVLARRVECPEKGT